MPRCGSPIPEKAQSPWKRLEGKSLFWGLGLQDLHSSPGCRLQPPTLFVTRAVHKQTQVVPGELSSSQARPRQLAQNMAQNHVLCLSFAARFLGFASLHFASRYANKHIAKLKCKLGHLLSFTQLYRTLRYTVQWMDKVLLWINYFLLCCARFSCFLVWVPL